MFYKLIKDNNIIGVISPENFRKFQTRPRFILFADEETGQFVEYHDNYYRDYWLRALPENSVSCTRVEIIRIEETEYNALLEALQTNEEIYIEEEPIEEPIIDLQEETDETIEFVRSAKIEQMSKICEQTIVRGFETVLSDGNNYHFSLTDHDQLKIKALADKAKDGDEPLFWHPDNGLCKFYTPEDILTIYEGMERMQLIHTTYYNSLKYYIKSLSSIEEIAAVQYGMDIPKEYQSEVWSWLLTQIQPHEKDNN